jgi:hypothetical protein
MNPKKLNLGSEVRRVVE